MAVSVNQGTVDTEARLADEKVVDMAPDISMLDTDTSQFMTMLSKLPSASCYNPKINWLEDQYVPAYSTLAVSAASTTGNIQVATGTGAYFRVGDVLMLGQTGEKIHVTGITSDVIAGTRSIGSVAAATAQTGTDVYNLGRAATQSADFGALLSTDRVLGYNYCEIKRNAFGFSKTDIETKTYGADDPSREIAKKAIEFKASLEKVVWAGGRDFTSNAPSSIGYCGGITEFLTSNVFSAYGSVSGSGLTGFDPKVQQVMQHGSMDKVLFANPKAAAGLSYLLANNWVRATPGETKYGAKVNAFINGAYGTDIPVIVKREWGAFGTSSKQLGGAVFLLDMQYIKKRDLRTQRLLSNIQDPGEDRVVYEYLAEFSLEVRNEAAHGVWYGAIA